MKFLALALALLPALAVAQNSTAAAAAPTTTAGIPTCVIACSTYASSVAGCSFIDPTCSCENTTFQAAANTCIGQNCSASDAQIGLQLQNATCASLASALPISGSVAGGNSTGAASGSGSGTGSASPASSTPAASSKSAAGSVLPYPSTAGLVSAVVLLVGMGIGAAVAM